MIFVDSLTQYKTLNKSSETVGKASIFLKAVNTLDNSDARISKRAQMPYKRLRGFERGKVGPKDGDDFIPDILGLSTTSLRGRYTYN